MNRKDSAGRAGRVTSERKAQAARINGAKGGRPRKVVSFPSPTPELAKLKAAAANEESAVRYVRELIAKAEAAAGVSKPAVATTTTTANTGGMSDLARQLVEYAGVEKLSEVDFKAIYNFTAMVCPNTERRTQLFKEWQNAFPVPQELAERLGLKGE